MKSQFFIVSPQFFTNLHGYIYHIWSPIFRFKSAFLRILDGKNHHCDGKKPSFPSIFGWSTPFRWRDVTRWSDSHCDGVPAEKPQWWCVYFSIFLVVAMYVCMFVCMYVCIYVCIYIYTYVCAYVYMYIYMGYHYLSYLWNIHSFGDEDISIYIYICAMRCWASGRVLNHSHRSMWDVWHSFFDGEFLLSFFVGKKPGISPVLFSWSIPKMLIFLLRFLGPGKTFGSPPLATFWIRQFVRAAWKLDRYVRLGLPTAIQEGIAPDEPPQTHHWGMVATLWFIRKNHEKSHTHVAFISISAGNFMNYANFCW